MRLREPQAIDSTTVKNNGCGVIAISGYNNDTSQMTQTTQTTYQTETTYLQNEAAMLEFAAQLSTTLKAGDVVYLEGNLGAGKTTLVRGILQHLGHTGAVKSPTYTLVEPYTLSTDSKLTIYHFDLYRLGDPEELEYMGGRDYFNHESICLVEWPEKAYGYLPRPDKRLKIDYCANGRKITFSIKNSNL